ncbi:MAG: MXAN_2562 family outer membrane beta-barrel protein [Pseudomonadota bacterium]
MKTCITLLPLVFLLAAPPALAEESPQFMAMEVRFGFYHPSIDDEFSGTGPYSSSFGDDDMIHFSGELDWQFWRPFGSLGLFGTAGYAWVQGRGLLADGSKSSDETKFKMVPLDMGLVYRMDVLAQKYKIPFVLAVKGGLTYAFWWMTDGLGETSSWTSTSGKKISATGGTMGLNAAIALHLHLDIFEPHSAKVFDNELGVNNSYLFVEYGVHWLNDFASGKSLDLTSHGLTFGLAFEM